MHSTVPDTLHITLGDVHPADISHRAINDEQLAMVTVVGFSGKRREANGQEGLDLNTRLAHLLEETVLHAPAAHVVVDDTHLNAFTGFRYQHVGHHTPQGIVLKDVDINVNVALGPGHVAQQGQEEIIAIGEQFHLIIIKGERETLVDKEVDDGLHPLGNLQVGLLHKAKHGALGQLVERTTADKSFAPSVHAKEEIEDEADDRDEQDDKCPSNGLHRLAIVQDDMDDRPDDDHLINGEYQVMPVHLVT